MLTRLFAEDGWVRSAADRGIGRRLGVELHSSGSVLDVVIDDIERRVFVLHTLSTDEAADARITVYDLDTLDRLDTALLRNPQEPKRMVCWSDRGLAITNYRGKTLLIEGG